MWNGTSTRPVKKWRNIHVPFKHEKSYMIWLFKLLYFTSLYFTLYTFLRMEVVLLYTMACNGLLYYTLLYLSMLCHGILYCIKLHCIRLILYYSTLYCSIIVLYVVVYLYATYCIHIHTGCISQCEAIQWSLAWWTGWYPKIWDYVSKLLNPGLNLHLPELLVLYFLLATLIPTVPWDH